tara:strand:+ start:600 stop:1064 length:465 start_codon:yes stop_codon:yes gene_type:complete
MPPKKKDTEKPKHSTLFSHINHIYEKQSKNYFDTLTDSDKRTYSTYMVNRFVSMNMHQLPLVSEIQKYNLSPEVHYLLLSSVLPRGRQFNKYIKPKTEDKYEQWVIELIAKHFTVSQDEAIFYLDIYYVKDKDSLRTICQMYGVDPKDIKKAKL